jgi:phosphoserine phosphatase
VRGSLPSWRDGAALDSIVAFITAVCDERAPTYVAPAERVAVFDKDGTLWCERPIVQAVFLSDRARALLAARPELRSDRVLRPLADGDLGAAIAAGGMPELLDAVAATDAGITVDAFAALATAWLAAATHPRFGRPYRELVYQPMLELIDLLQARGVRVYIVTGGGVEFVRAVGEELYGIPPDDVIGSSLELELVRVDERLELVRQPRFRGSPNEGAPKPVNIQAHVGRRPILAAGNSAGDREMLEYATTGPRPALGLVVDHDDAEREFAYVGASVTDPDAEPVMVTARRLGWTCVSMRDDWLRVFPHDPAT